MAGLLVFLFQQILLRRCYLVPGRAGLLIGSKSPETSVSLSTLIERCRVQLPNPKLPNLKLPLLPLLPTERK